MSQERKPDWLKVHLPTGQKAKHVKKLLRDCDLNTVCENAKCPNMGECFGKGTATFMILGDICTRNCRFCAVESGNPRPVNEEEPRLIAQAAEELGLSHTVVTSVTRDDLPDGGSRHFARVIRQVKKGETTVEVLVPDFRGDEKAIARVVEAGPDVLNHNVETVPTLYDAVRPQADYSRSLDLLRRAKELNSDLATKSGLMLGLGERKEQVRGVFRDLLAVGSDYLTLGQYLRPTREHLPVDRYLTPREFEEYRVLGEQMGFKKVFAGPLVRSSYNAAAVFDDGE